MLEKTSFIIIWHGHDREVYVVMLLVWDYSLGLAKLGNVCRLSAGSAC